MLKRTFGIKMEREDLVFRSCSRRPHWSFAWRCIGNRVAWVMGLLLSVTASVGWAGTYTYPNNGASTLSLSFGASPISVPRDAAVGKVISTINDIPGAATSNVTCPVTRATTVAGTLVPGTTNVYQTNVQGIGVTFQQTQGWQGGFESVPQVETYTPPATGGTATYFQAQLVVTGQVAGSGTVTSIPQVTMQYTGSCFSTVTATFTIAAAVPITALACTVTTPTINVPLPTVPVNALLPAGTMSALSVGNTANIGLSCSPGSNVYITLTDANSPGNTSSNLTLGSGSTAGGVALRLFKDGTPVKFGPDLTAAGNLNQWLVGASSGVSSIPLTVQYVSTGPVRAGSVNAAATFTMSYQ